LKLAVGAAAVFAAVALVAPTANAAGTFTGYAWDGNPHVIVSGGSETTYFVMTTIGKVWQESSNSGCLHSTGASSTQMTCSADQANNLMNYQGDTVAMASPSGSGGGIAALNGNAGLGGTYEGTVNPISNPSRKDPVRTTSGSSTVTDPFITNADAGMSVSELSSPGSVIPANSYVANVTANTSFTLSSAPDQNLAVTATATTPAQHVDGAAAVHNGLSNVDDTAILATDEGANVTGTGIPANTYARNVVPGTGFTLASNFQGSPVNTVNATSDGTGVTVTPNLGVNIQRYFCVNGTTGPNPDFARSSRDASTTGGSAPCGNELSADTFWGYGQDGNEVFGFNNTGALLGRSIGNGGPNITAQQLFQVWNCFGGTGSLVGVARNDNATRTDTNGAGVPAAVVSLSNGSSTVTDSKAVASDKGDLVTSSGITGTVYVGTVNTAVTPHTFVLSSTRSGADTPVNATADASSLQVNLVTVQNGSAVINDSAIAVGDIGHGVTGMGIPASSFVGSVNATAHTFLLSSSQTSQQPVGGVPATADAQAVTVNPTQRMDWHDLDPGDFPTTAGQGGTDIQPWGMNSASGTFATFNNYIIANATDVPAGWTMDSAACDRHFSGGVFGSGFPLENDIKPLLLDTTLSSTITDPNNPENWMWQGSFGNLSAFSFLSSDNVGGTQYTAIQTRIGGNLAGFSNIGQRTWPLFRVLFHVTRKSDADCVKTAGACDFNGHVGPALPAPLVGNDLNVTGATGGPAGAVREFTRALCRLSNTQQGTDPYTGKNFGDAITSALSGAGFTVIKTANQTPGSRCQVHS
jgi:hypothetical protein